MILERMNVEKAITRSSHKVNMMNSNGMNIGNVTPDKTSELHGGIDHQSCDKALFAISILFCA